MPSSLALAGFLLSSEETALGSACAQLNQMLAPQAMEPQVATSNERGDWVAARKLFGTTEPACTFGGNQTTPSDGPNLVRWFAITGLGLAIATEGRSIPKDGIDFFTQRQTRIPGKPHRAIDPRDSP